MHVPSHRRMFEVEPGTQITRKLVDALYVEAMVLADEARAYFDRYSHDDREQLDPILRVSFSCESLKVTTRLMHIIAWLLTRRAVDNGEMAPLEAMAPNYALGDAVTTQTGAMKGFPQEAQELIMASCRLYDRVKLFDRKILAPELHASPARSLLRQLERAF